MGIARIPGGGTLGGGILAPKGAKDHFLEEVCDRSGFTFCRAMKKMRNLGMGWDRG